MLQKWDRLLMFLVAYITCTWKLVLTSTFVLWIFLRISVLARLLTLFLHSEYFHSLLNSCYHLLFSNCSEPRGLVEIWVLLDQHLALGFFTTQQAVPTAACMNHWSYSALQHSVRMGFGNLVRCHTSESAMNWASCKVWHKFKVLISILLLI